MKATKLRVMPVLAAVLLLWVGSSGRSSAADNVVENPDFATDLSKWTTHATGALSVVEWSSQDVDSSPSSGSARVQTDPAGSSYIEQCVPLHSDRTYEMSSYVLLPTGQSGTPEVYFGPFWYSDPNCSTFLIGESAVLSTPASSWQLLSWTPIEIPPLLAQSALITAEVYPTGATAAVNAYFDKVNVAADKAIVPLQGNLHFDTDLTSWTGVPSGPSSSVLWTSFDSQSSSGSGSALLTHLASDAVPTELWSSCAAVSGTQLYVVRPATWYPTQTTDGLEVVLDDVQLGSLHELVFANGFELGATSAWSATVP